MFLSTYPQIDWESSWGQKVKEGCQWKNVWEEQPRSGGAKPKPSSAWGHSQQKWSTVQSPWPFLKNPLDFQSYGIGNKDSTNLPECWVHLLPRLQQLQGSLCMAWHRTAFLGSLRSWPINSVKTRVQLRWILAVCAGPGGDYCHQECNDLYCSAQAYWKRFMKCFPSAQIPARIYRGGQRHGIYSACHD